MNKPTLKQAGLIGTLLLFLALFFWGRTADAAEVRLGVGYGYGPNDEAIHQEAMLTSSDRHWYAAITRIGNDALHNYKYWRYTAGYRVNWRKDKNFSPFLRLGWAGFSEPPVDYISEKHAYDLAIGIRLWHVLELEFDQHNSTAGRSDDNSGLDAVHLGFVLPF